MWHGFVSDTIVVTATWQEVLPEHILSKIVITSLQKNVLNLSLLHGDTSLFLHEKYETCWRNPLKIHPTWSSQSIRRQILNMSRVPFYHIVLLQWISLSLLDNRHGKSLLHNNHAVLWEIKQNELPTAMGNAMQDALQYSLRFFNYTTQLI